MADGLYANPMYMRRGLAAGVVPLNPGELGVTLDPGTEKLIFGTATGQNVELARADTTKASLDNKVEIHSVGGVTPDLYPTLAEAPMGVYRVLGIFPDMPVISGIDHVNGTIATYRVDNHITQDITEWSGNPTLPPSRYTRDWGGGSWTPWVRWATATPPEYYGGTFDASIGLDANSRYVYCKDQFNMVQLDAHLIKPAGVSINGKTIATMPAGFMIFISNGTAVSGEVDNLTSQAYIEIRADGAIVFSSNIPDDTAAAVHFSVHYLAG